MAGPQLNPWLDLVRVAGRSPRRSVRQVSAALDLARSTGPAYLLRRRREEQLHARANHHNVGAVYKAIWTEAAGEVGAAVADLGSGFLEFRKASARTRVWLHWVELEDIVANRISLDKARVHDLLTNLGLPTPQHVELESHDIEAAMRFIDSRPGPCVVKPASGTSGGDGVTSGVSNREEFLRARLRASRGDSRLLIEGQVPGSAFRLLILDGKLLDAVRRHSPSVVGDGESSVAELIAAENRRRLTGGGWAGFRLLTVDLEAVLTLLRQGLDLASIPEQGIKVTVKVVESQNAASENETVRDEISDELVEELSAAAGAVGLRLAGIDLVAPDLARPLGESGGAIIEVNGTPGFQYHYLVAEPERATRIAVPILRTLLEEARGRGAGRRLDRSESQAPP